MTYKPEYIPPVAQLLTLGDARPTMRKWPEYRALGLTAADIPELMRMVTDAELLWAPSESDLVWAPVHAWRALGELHAEEAIAPLLAVLTELESDDYACEELPDVFALIGPSAIPALRDYLDDQSHHLWPRVNAIEALTRIAALHPNVRDRVIDLLVRRLSQFRAEDPEINAFLVSGLIDLQAVRALSIIKLAFDADMVDASLRGGWDIIKEKFPPVEDSDASVQIRETLLSEVEFLRPFLDNQG